MTIPQQNATTMVHVITETSSYFPLLLDSMIAPQTKTIKNP